MRKVDYLIIGQGLAGSILAYQLLQKNKSVMIIDQGSGSTASRQATGLINPITGRRFVKSWMIDDLLPFAQNFYFELSKALHTPFYKETKQYKVLQNLEQVNDFNVRMHDDGYSKYLEKPSEKPSDSIIEAYSSAQVQPLLQINVPLMQDAFLNFFKEKGILIETFIDYKDVIYIEDHYQYDDCIADKVIFAEGFKLKDNPYFNFLPIQIAKGEALIIKSENLNLNVILNSKTNLTPLGNHHYYVGATYDWNSFEQKPTEEKKNYLESNLKKSINCSYELIDHKVGIRPTVLDRRPLLGEHPSNKGMYVFNGMGTKGLSLAPYFATALIAHIEEGQSLHPEVAISRFI